MTERLPSSEISDKKLFTDALEVFLNRSSWSVRLKQLFFPRPQHKTVKVPEVRRLVKQQFMKNAHETDSAKIDALKNNALSALTNYVMYISQRWGDFLCLFTPAGLTYRSSHRRQAGMPIKTINDED